MERNPETVEQALLDDIVAGHESSVWGILADWLEDRDDPRAELVRLTWPLQSEPDHPEFAARQRRVQELLAGGLVPVRPRQTLESIEFAWIPAGTFLMGSPEKEKDRSGDEKQHPVTLTKGFYLGIYPVTQGQWRDVMGDNPSEFSRQGDNKEKVKDISGAELDRFPVENMSWNMAQDFCKKLTQRLGRLVRLPTEAEWEYACRAGTLSRYSFGDDESSLAQHAWFSDNSESRTHEVGKMVPNAWGLHDMHGNVWEWCEDAFLGDLTKLTQNDPLNKGQPNDRRVVRGGSWGYLARNCRAAYRNDNAPDNRNDNNGLRVVVALP